jgi:quinol monooxygenase YgiN
VCLSGQISWRVELVIKPGRLESFRALTGEMVESARRELGILSYQRFVSEDGKTVHVYERYVDSTAALTHLEIFAKEFAEPFQNMAERKCFVVFGCPTAELKTALDGYGAIYFEPFGDSPIGRSPHLHAERRSWHNAKTILAQRKHPYGVSRCPHSG